MLNRKFVLHLRFVLFLGITLFGYHLSAQEENTSRPVTVDIWDTLNMHTVKINPLAWFHPAVFYEYNIYRRHSLEASLGGAPQFGSASGVHNVGMAGAALHYRFYFAHWRIMLFFVQTGGDFFYASGNYNVFDGGSGWDIRIRQYRYHRMLAFPDIGFGYKLLCKDRFMVEVIGSVPLSHLWHKEDNDRLFGDAKVYFESTQLLAIKIGWSF